MWLTVISIVLLAAVTYSDFKKRAISLLLLIALTITILFNYLKFDFPQIFYYLINAVVLIMQIGIMSIWFKYKNKDKSFFKEAFGWGDVWLLGIGVVIFEPIWFVWFLLITAVASLLTGLVLRQHNKNKEVTIPLAGVASVVIIAHNVYKLL